MVKTLNNPFTHKVKCQILAVRNNLLLEEKNYKVYALDYFMTVKYEAVSYRQMYEYLKQLDR